MKRIKIALIFVTLLLSLSCNKKPEKLLNHNIKFIKIRNNVNLEILDWGGNGTPMLFLSGLGNSAHVFDNFAPRFTDEFHVYALTRRGFGSSSQPENGYDLATLCKDIISIINKLHFKKVILVGHSIAGEEITKIAANYPDKVDKIIYLDAAYDRTELGKLFAVMPEFPTPKAADSTSFQTVKKFLKKVNGINVPDEDLREITIFSKEGKYLKDVTPNSIAGALYRMVIKPDYKNINCPALAIYATQNSAKDLIPFYENLDSINKNKANQLFVLWSKFEKENPEKFLNESKNGVVKKIKGHHYIFISNPNETEKFMRDFLE